MKEKISLPHWWGDADKMLRLLYARAEHSSDRAALREQGLGGCHSLSNLLAWGEGRRPGPANAAKAEAAAAQEFAACWRTARDLAPTQARRRAMGVRKAGALTRRLREWRAECEGKEPGEEVRSAQ